MSKCRVIVKTKSELGKYSPFGYVPATYSLISTETYLNLLKFSSWSKNRKKKFINRNDRGSTNLNHDELVYVLVSLYGWGVLQ